MEQNIHFNIKEISADSVLQRQGHGVIQVIDLGYHSKFEIFTKSSDFGSISDFNIKSKSNLNTI